jgi:hypothetical protein
MGTLLTRVRRAFIELNLFRSGLNEVEVVQQERWSTRLYLILMITALVILVIYTALGMQTVHVVVDDPSLSTYQTLQLKYTETLQCPCSQIAVKYRNFIQMQPIYHPVRYVNILDRKNSKRLIIIIDMFQCICVRRMDFSCLWN